MHTRNPGPRRRSHEGKPTLTLVILLSIVLLAALGRSAVSAPHAQAFDLGYHADKVHQIAQMYKLSSGAELKLLKGDLWTDVSTVIYDHILPKGASKRKYLDEAHFDNKFNLEQIDTRWRDLRALAQNELPILCNRGPDETLLFMGHILHTVEDFYAHSDYVQLMRQTAPPPGWDRTGVSRQQLSESE